MNRQRPLILAVALAAGLTTAGAARAHGARDANWPVTIGAPRIVLPGVVLQAPPVSHVRVQPVVHPRPGYRQPTRWDVDGDGIPNHRDRTYNPRWDIDGDGIPNHRDRVYNPRWDVDGDGIPNRRDRHDGGAPRHDRDRDGVPDRWDRHPSQPGRGR